MHKVEFPEELLAKAAARRGTAHPFADFDPARTALVVVDLQNYFMKPGAPVEVPLARGIVPNVNRLAKALRQAGGLVVWIKTIADESENATWSVMHSRLMNPENAEKRIASLSDGHDYHDLWPELDVRPEDMICLKRRYSAFVPGSSDLDDQLKTRSMRTLLITGTATNVCCESTARDAMMMDYEPIMVSDGLAADTDDLHMNALTSLYMRFADVMTTDEIIAAMAR